ncbi:MAG TPA: bifunctional hydroxymethylpyrimidine kinase/phosphomethylpyrimidine kinase, partial [Candidatus Sumerlaeota bacterium]|nr:bifunctional hydroxymethylpyrimidine kinase/phosphomethylpyrimidine kinase [Candidatus Sumerlaeota bacterium]
EKLFPMALLVTPNLDEAADITGIIPESEKDMPRIANRILEMGPKWVLVKGGHLSGSAAVDYLTDGKEAVRLEHARLDAQHTHGTGCTLSAAITAYIARGEAVIPAVSKAKDYVTRGIRAGVAIGGGISPINHLSRDLREHP